MSHPLATRWKKCVTMRRPSESIRRGVLCVASGSEKYLPTLTSEQFDVIFIDGMVGFPRPILDGTTLTIISKSAAW